MVLGWNIPASQQFCLSVKQNITCDLNHLHPLKSNYDIVSQTWWSAFLMTAWATCAASLSLLICQYYLWGRQLKMESGEYTGPKEKRHDPVARSIIILERVIDDFSTQQTIAGLSLVVVAGHFGCKISAYDYNLVCFQLIMSVISHLNALTNANTWFGEDMQSLKRLIVNGITKIIPVLLMIIMTGVMMGARLGTNFPSSASALATFPAACFENTNGTASLTEVKTVVVDHKADWGSNGFIQYLILVVDLILAGIITAIALIKKIKRRPDGFRVRLSFFLRAISTLATTVTLIWLSVKYIAMRRNMESNTDWYVVDSDTSDFNYFNIVTWALFASSALTVVTAFSEAYISNAAFELYGPNRGEFNNKSVTSQDTNPYVTKTSYELQRPYSSAAAYDKTTSYSGTTAYDETTPYNSRPTPYDNWK